MRFSVWAGALRSSWRYPFVDGGKEAGSPGITWHTVNGPRICCGRAHDRATPLL